ncbi:hypothetical protein ACFE04_021840 [Oxalis oulophora]
MRRWRSNIGTMRLSIRDYSSTNLFPTYTHSNLLTKEMVVALCCLGLEPVPNGKFHMVAAVANRMLGPLCPEKHVIFDRAIGWSTHVGGENLDGSAGCPHASTSTKMEVFYPDFCYPPNTSEIDIGHAHVVRRYETAKDHKLENIPTFYSPDEKVLKRQREDSSVTEDSSLIRIKVAKATKDVEVAGILVVETDSVEKEVSSSSI